MSVMETPALGTVTYEAQRLDRLRPGWAEAVSPGWLKLASFSRCILGQVYGDFGTGWVFVRSDLGWIGSMHDAVVHLYCYPANEDAWREEVQRRK
jgi:hypothetical protein